VAISTGGIAALTTSQIFAIQTSDIAVLRTSQIAALTTEQAAVLSMNQFVAFTTAQSGALTTAAFNALDPAAFASPIVLDLNGDGVKTLSVSEGVKFDLFDNGKKVNTGWVSSGDGLLVLDRNHDGIVNTGAELFGTSTQLSDGTRASDGYTALREFDANNDGLINRDDAVFADLRVWIDGNSDGVSDAGETKSLDSLGISSINLTGSVGNSIDNGNVLGLVSSYETADGVTHAAADVWFSVDVVAPVPADAGTTIGASNDLRSRVSSLAQAMGSFAEGGLPDVGLTLPTLNVSGGGMASSTGVAAPVASGMADAMKQFDVQGGLLGKPDLVVASVDTKLNFPGLQDPNSAGLLTGSGKG
jgi:Ca2+-binding EF-hand superfamily protein